MSTNFRQFPVIFNNVSFFPPPYRFFHVPFIFLLPLGYFIHFCSLLVVAPSTLHWLMFAYALACILIFGQCPFIFNNFPFFLLLIVFVLICLHFSSFSWIFHPFPFSRWHSPLYLCIANNFDTFWEMLRDLLGGRHISCMHLLAVAPSTLHWVMFAYALACLLIFGQCPFIFNNFPYFPPAYRFFLEFPFIFLLRLALSSIFILSVAFSFVSMYGE